MTSIFDFELEAKIEDNKLSYVELHNVAKGLENDGCKPSFGDLMKLNEELAKTEKVSSLKLRNLWLEKHSISSNTINVNHKLKNDNELKGAIKSQENWVKQNESLLKYWGVI